jgi:hypothetical protein
MIRRTANISLSRARIFIPLGPIEEESARPSGWRGWLRANLLAWNPSRRVASGTSVSFGHTRARPPCGGRSSCPYVMSVPPGCTWRSERSNQFHLPATFTWTVCGSSLAVSRGFRRARHFTYAAGCPRANLSGANVTLPDTLVDILVADFGLAFCHRPGVHRIPRVFDTRAPRAVPLPMLRPAAPLNRKAAY